MERKWFGNFLPWKAKKVKNIETDGVSCQIVSDVHQRSKANSVDSMDALSSASSGIHAASKTISLQQTNAAAAFIPSSQKALSSMTLSAPQSTRSDESTQASSAATTCSALTQRIGTKEVKDCFDDMSAMSSESELYVIDAVEKHIIEWEFTSNLTGWYSGPLRGGSIPHGRGSCVLDNGDKYEGPFHEGKMHGPSATLVKADGSIYSGDIFNNLPHGYGAYRTPSRLHVGKFERGVPHGEGALYYLDGSIDFEGQWVFGEAVVDVKDLDFEMLAELVAPLSLENLMAASANEHKFIESGELHDAKETHTSRQDTERFGYF
jgi:hypothetical protein